MTLLTRLYRRFFPRRLTVEEQREADRVALLRYHEHLDDHMRAMSGANPVSRGNSHAENLAAHHKALYSEPIMLCLTCDTSQVSCYLFNSCPEHGWDGARHIEAFSFSSDHRK